MKESDEGRYSGRMEEQKDKVYKVLIVSDSHGNTRYVRYAIGQEAPFDALVHCGDVCADLDRDLGEGRDYGRYVVRGNMDYTGKKEITFDLGGRHFLVVHGDEYGVKYNNTMLLRHAREIGADTALFGHSHVPEVSWSKDGVLLVNPGSVALPHQLPRVRTYAVMTWKEGEKPDVAFREIPESVF